MASAPLAVTTMALVVLAHLEVSLSLEASHQLKKEISIEVTRVLNDFTCNCSLSMAPCQLEEAVERLEEKLDALTVTMDSQEVETAVCEDGSAPSQAAGSCAMIFNCNVNAVSGYYWVRNAANTSHRVYCDMTRSCGGRCWRLDESDLPGHVTLRE